MRNRWLVVAGGLPFCFAACGVVELPFPDDGGDDEIAGGEDRSQGLDPTEALATTAEGISTPAPEDPFVENGERKSCEDVRIRDLYVPDPEVANEVESLARSMSIEQKVLQMTGQDVPDYENNERWDNLHVARDDAQLGLRGARYRNGTRGINLADATEDGQANYATSFPVAIAQGATFDRDLVRRVGVALGDEALASGATVVLAPSVNVIEHPRWGLAQAAFGEDTFHVGRLATSLTLGIQERIAACAQHLIHGGNESDSWQHHVVDAQTEREVLTRPVEMVVRDGGVSCVMASGALMTGGPVTQDPALLTDLLRNEIGFRGQVISDRWAIPAPENNQGNEEYLTTMARIDARKALEAGLDVELPWAIHYATIPELLARGELQEGIVNRSVKRVLEQKLRFQSAYLDEPVGLQASSTSYDPATGSVIGTEAHLTLARETAEKAMVLLKNEPLDGDTPVLPITSGAKVAVLGKVVNYELLGGRLEQTFDFLRDAALGEQGDSNVEVDPALTVGPLSGLEMAAPEGVEIVAGASASDAADADIVVVVVGLTPGDEGEGFTGAGDRDSLELSEEQTTLITEAAALGKPVIVVVEAGSVVDMPWLDQVQAVVMAWYPGQRGGEALGRLLFGHTNFSGHLPLTWPASASQLAEFPPPGDTVEHDYFVGYKRFDQLELTPLFAFGHGLSYSTFSLERLHVPCESVTQNALIEVEVDVRNVSDRAGDEVVFVFASYLETAVRRPIKELKGFARVSLAAGEAQRVTIPIRLRDLAYWNARANEWVVEPGTIQLAVGPSADRLLLSQTIEVQ